MQFIMKNQYSFMLLFIILLQIGIKQPATSQTLPKDDPLYELVFVEEFDDTTLNTNKWDTQWPWSKANMINSNFIHHENGDSMDVALLRHAPFNQGNWAFNTTGTGYVRMIYKKENCQSNIWIYKPYFHDSLVPFKYTGAMMRSKERFKYGYFEYKFKVDNPAHDLPDSATYNAYGPNFWLWNSDTNNYNPAGMPRQPAKYSELDILELRGTNWTGDANIHYQKMEADTFFHAKGDITLDSNIVAPSPYDKIDTYLLPNIWHTVGCEWTKQYADFYYDAPNFHRRYSDSLTKIDELIEMPITIDNYMPAFQFWIHFDTLLTKHPIYYDIDYVKVYQAKQEYVDKNLLNATSLSFESKVYKSLTVGGAGGNAIFNTGKQHLCAEEFVLLKENTEVSGDAEVTISCRPYQHDQWYGYKSGRDNYTRQTVHQLIETKMLPK